MNYKNPKYQFLNENPNPNLEELLLQFKTKKKEPCEVISNLKTKVSSLKVSKKIFELIEKLDREITNEKIFEAGYTLKAIKTYPLFKGDLELRKCFQEIHQLIDGYHMSPIEKALFLLCDLIFLHKSIYTPLTTIKDELSSEAFILYVTFQTIGCVNGDGWAYGVFGNMPQLVPYIPDSLEELGYKKVPEAIRNTVSVFPEHTNFLFDDEECIDVLNFIENPRRKIDNPNPKLEKYTKEEREQFCRNYHHSLEKIEEVEDEIWNENDEWSAVFKYYNDNLDKKIWKITHNTL